MNNEISNTIISNIGKINVYLSSKNNLRADVLDKKGASLFPKSLSLTELNKVLDAMLPNPTDTLIALMSENKIEYDSKIFDYYTMGLKHFAKLKYISKENIGSIKIADINRINASLDKKGELIATVFYNDGSEVHLGNVDLINALLDLFYAKGANDISDLWKEDKLIVTKEVYGNYNFLDGKHFNRKQAVVKDNPTKGSGATVVEPKAPKATTVKPVEKTTVKNDFDSFRDAAVASMIIGLNAADNSLLAQVLYDDKTIEEVSDINEINSIIDGLSSVEAKTLSELIAARKVIITDEAKKLYGMDDRKISLLAKETVEKTEEVIGHDSEVEEEKPKKEKKSRVKIRKVFKRAVAWTVGLAIAGLGIAGLIHHHKSESNNNNQDAGSNDTKVSDEYEETNQGMIFLDEDENVVYEEGDSIEDGRIYRIDIGDSVYDGYYYEEPDNTSSYNSSHKYDYLGSCIDYDNIYTQIDTIDDSVMRYEPFLYENLVIADDYDAIKAISDMRNDVVYGKRTQKEFMDMISQYVFENNNYVNGNFVESYKSLHPYGQYLVIRMSQGVLQWDTSYRSSSQYMMYDFENLSNSYDVMGSYLYETLIQAENTK